MTPEAFDRIDDLLRRVRRRWMRVRAWRAAARTALVASAVVAIALVAARLVGGRSAGALAAIGFASVVGGAVALSLGMRRIRRAPDDRQVARFVEERIPSLDDRLASAVDVARGGQAGSSPALIGPMLADTAARADAIDPREIITDETVRRAWFQAGGALIVLATLLVVAVNPAREAYDAAALVLFPGHVTLDVTPGNARVKAGTPFEVNAHLRGSRAPVLARVEATTGDRARTVEMAKDGSGFRASMGVVNAAFKYRVVAGAAVSPEYAVAVVRPPRVARIDVDYNYPSGLGLAPRTDEDSGDVYAPAGTSVRLHVHTDRAAARVEMTLGDGKIVRLSPDSATAFSTAFTLADDNSYRVSLVDAEGLTGGGDTEYFMRILEDRPPNVRIVKPAADRAVTRLEEVDIEAQADDDYGLDRLDLVYSVRGAAEQVVSLRIPPRATSATARHTLALEDLNVQPGDLISYYVRARDITRGKRANETKSDLYFLEVRPYEQEFTLAQSSAMSGASGGSIDDLVAAQKEVVVATWKLERRAQANAAAKSEQDIRSVSRAEGDLKSRVEQTSSTFRESTMRDPRRRPQPGAPRVGETMPEEDDMTAASAAMGKAVASLDALKTNDALSPEMTALNHLLKAQADVKKREVSRQQTGNGAGNNNRNYDMSTLFDKELQRQTETNYENRSSGDTSREESAESALDKIHALARRQDELTKAQQELAKARASLTEDELQRRLEQLTREQSQLRQQAEDLSQQMSGSQAAKPGAQSGKPQNGGASSSSSSSSGGGADASQPGAERAKALRDASEEMRSAASELRRQDPGEASARGSRALDRLRALERQLQNATPEQRRRALGEAQLEARQLADAERQLADDMRKASSGAAAGDERRRMAGEQERLAGRARSLQDALKQQGETEAAGELQRQQVPDKMAKAADALRGADADPRRQADTPQQLARSLDKAAEALGAETGSNDAEANKLSSQLGRVQELKDKMQRLSDEIQRLGRQDGRGSNQPSAQKTPGTEGRGGQGEGAGGGGTGVDLANLRQEYERQLQETQALMNELRRDDPNFSRGGAGFTYEGQGMTLSAPGTEAFKQDFANWEQLRVQATQALDAAETTLSKKLQSKQARDRLAAGVDDKAPADYQKQVDTYFKALAAKKKGG